MATVRAECPACGNGLKFPSSWAGKAMKCKKCDAVITAKVTAAAKPVEDDEPVAIPISAMVSAGVADQIPSIPTIPTIPTIAPAVAFPTIQPQTCTPDFVSPNSAFPDPSFAVNPGRPRYKKSSGGLAKFIALAVTLAIGSGAGIFGFQYYQKQKTSGTGDNTIAQGPGDAKTSKTTSTLASESDARPRRFLFINCTKYAYLNPLTAGQGGQGDKATENGRKIAFEWRIPSNPDNNQLYTLTDSITKDAATIVRATLQPTIDRFCETSRKQDRIAIYFGGHAIEKDGKAYLAAADGDPDDITSLVPLEAIYERLKNCPAQQKLIIWDVCRFNPQYGRSMPGSEPMSESLHKLLASPPLGVQAWITCSPGENAVELTKSGSEFLSAFRIAAERAAGPKGGAGPSDPIPVAEWLTASQSKLSQLVTKDGKPGQTMMLAGALSGDAVAYSKDEAFPGRFDFPAPPKGADPLKVSDIYGLLTLPSIRSDKNSTTENAGQSLFISDEAIKDYLVDPVSLDDAIKQKATHPIRAAAAKSILTMRQIWKGAEGGDGSGLRETFVGEASDAAKKSILKEQEVPARIILELETIVFDLEKLEKELDKEPSKRWKATFQFALAQARARWAFMNEYNLMLGVIQKNELPPLDEAKGQSGWAMISNETMKSKKDVKEKLESSVELFDKIATEHKGTPWAVLAKQSRNAKLGLEWRTVGPDDKRE